MKEKIEQHCSHNFEYSHQEIIQQGGSTTMGNFGQVVDVVICTKCGLVRRN